MPRSGDRVIARDRKGKTLPPINADDTDPNRCIAGIALGDMRGRGRIGVLEIEEGSVRDTSINAQRFLDTLCQRPYP
jgi:hypothetical protein